MHSVQTGVFAAFQKIGCAHIGGQHAFFNQTVCIVAALGHNFVDLAIGVEHHLGFNRVNFHGTATLARLKQHLEQRVQVFDIAVHVAHCFGGKALRISERIPNLVISQASRRVDHCVVKLVGLDRTFGANNHVAHQHQAIHAGVQRTQTVRQFLWQHGNDPAREIHRGATLGCLLVNRCAGQHIVAYISNGHQQTPTAFGVV